ncbi:MAG: anti-sigma factor antagonist [Planctomycetes bacterium]|nr:anti-sigma factor antagonist [Planctomycetota bacterium]
MAVQNWSENILVATPPQDPGFTEDLNEVMDLIGANDRLAVVVDMKDVDYVGSSNLSLLLRLRKRLLNHTQRLVLCSVNTKIWSTLLLTGLDSLFVFADNVTTALAGIEANRQNQEG